MPTGINTCTCNNRDYNLTKVQNTQRQCVPQLLSMKMRNRYAHWTINIDSPHIYSSSTVNLTLLWIKNHNVKLCLILNARCSTASKDAIPQGRESREEFRHYTTTFTRQPFLYRCRVILGLWFLYVKYYAVHKTSTKCSVNNAKCLLNNICATLFHNFVTTHVVVTSLFEKDRCRYF